MEVRASYSQGCEQEMGEKIKSQAGTKGETLTIHSLLASQGSLAEMKALGTGKKDAPAVLYGTSCGHTFQSPELVMSPASLRLSSGQQGGQASPWSQTEEQTGQGRSPYPGDLPLESSYFLLKIPRIQDFQSSLLGVQPA